MRGTWQTTDSGGGGSMVAALVAAVVIAAVAVPVLRVLAELLEVVAVIVAVLAVLAVAALVTAWQVRRRRRGGAGVVHRAVVLSARQEPTRLPARRVAGAIEAPRGDVSAYPREHADTHVVTSRGPRPRCTRQTGRRS